MLNQTTEACVSCPLVCFSIHRCPEIKTRNSSVVITKLNENLKKVKENSLSGCFCIKNSTDTSQIFFHRES